MSTEVWKPISGYEQSYEVSDLGRVRSLDRVDRLGRRRVGRVLSPFLDNYGYPKVDLCQNGTSSVRFVHTLVLETFVGPRPPSMECCHGDGRPTNNTVENLRWDTSSANEQDKKDHGTHKFACRNHCSRGHEYTPENTAYRASRPGHRICRECQRIHGRTKRLKKRLA